MQTLTGIEATTAAFITDTSVEDATMVALTAIVIPMQPYCYL